MTLSAVHNSPFLLILSSSGVVSNKISEHCLESFNLFLICWCVKIRPSTEVIKFDRGLSSDVSHTLIVKLNTDVINLERRANLTDLCAANFYIFKFEFLVNFIRPVLVALSVRPVTDFIT